MQGSPHADHLPFLGIVRIVDQSSGGITDHEQIDLAFRRAVHMAEDGLGNSFKQLEDTLVGLEILLDVRTKACINDDVHRLLAPAERLNPRNAVFICDRNARGSQLFQAVLPLDDPLYTVTFSSSGTWYASVSAFSGGPAMTVRGQRRIATSEW